MKILIIVSAVTLVLNIPFGYWRANVKRFSLQWFLAIHIPIPFILFLRIILDIGFGWNTYLFLVISFFLGQKIGITIHRFLKKTEIVSSCLFMDLSKLFLEN